MTAVQKIDETADWTASAPEAALIVDVDGFEGPLDLLLTLARSQKVDLARISILSLVEQYLAFVEAARKLRLELAADYIVMAAWLAYLKSRLLLPSPEQLDDEPSAEELAGILSHRLRRLEAMREAAAKLLARPRLGVDSFARGAPEPIAIAPRNNFHATLYDLLSAYAGIRQKEIRNRVTFRRRTVWSLAEARSILERLVGRIGDWLVVEGFLTSYMTSPELKATVRASTFSATLEMVREGKIELRQSGAYQPLYIRPTRAGDKP